MRIALATCDSPPAPDSDAVLLIPALAERRAEAELVDWRDPDAAWADFDLVLISSTWDYHRHLDEFKEWLRRVEGATRLENPAALVEWNLDKSYLREVDEAGVTVVPTIWADPEGGAAATREAVARGWERLVVKPAVDLGASRLERVNVIEARRAIDRIDGPCLVQPYLDSLESEGELSLVYLRGELSHAVRKIPAGGDFRVQEQYGGRYEPAEPPAEAVRLGSQVITLLGSAGVRLTGGEGEPPLYGRVDVVADPDGALCVIELELIEPSLYLDVAGSEAAERVAAALLDEVAAR